MATTDLTINIPSFFYKIKELEGFEDAIIAGGFIRDQFLGKKFKDVDIFFPVKGKTDFLEKMYKLQDKLPELNLKAKKMDNYTTAKFLGKYDGSCDGFDIDIIGNKIGNKAFGTNLVETFNYGIDRIYCDGSEITMHPDFETDVKLQVINLRELNRGMDDLPHVMEKYFRLKEKYPNYSFTTNYTLEKRRGDDWL